MVYDSVYEANKYFRLPVIPATAVTEETLDSTNGTASWNVDNGGSDITIDTGNNEIDITGTGQKSGYYDLGASVSASAWVLRFKIASSGSPSGNPLFWVGMFDVNTIDSRNTNVDGISLMMYTGSTYKLSMKNGSHMDSGGSQTDTSPTVSADTTTRYVEIVRNGSNAILTFYDSDTYTTSIGTCTVAITGTSFRYLCAISYFEGSGRTYSLSNVKLYNGVTSVEPAHPDVRKQHFWEYFSGSKLQEFPTYTDDFSSDGWTDSDSTYIGVSGGSMNWNCKRDGTNDASVYDLSSTSANWVLRFKLKVTNVSASTQAGNGFYVGLSDSNQTAGQSTSQDFIGVSIYNDNTDTYRTIDADGSALPAIYQGDSSQSTTYNTNSIWYYEIIKTGSSYTVEAFSGSDYSTGSEGKITGSSNATGLRYLKVLNDMANIPTSTNPFQGTIDDLKFYNGVSTPSGRWTTTALGTTTGSTGAMDDEAGGGYKITTSANNNDRLELDFNDKRQFSPTASRVLSVWKLGGTNALTNAIAEVGLMSAAYDEFNIHRAVWSMNTAFASAAFFLKASDGGSTSSDHSYVWTTVPLDESYHIFESVLSSSGFTGSVDGVAQGTATTHLPTVSMQPHIDRQAKISEVKTMNIKYFEAYNT